MLTKKLTSRKFCSLAALSLSLLLSSNLSHACFYGGTMTTGKAESYRCVADENSIHYEVGQRLCCQKGKGCDTKKESHCSRLEG